MLSARVASTAKDALLAALAVLLVSLTVGCTPSASPASSTPTPSVPPPAPAAAVPDIPRFSASLSERPALSAPAPVRLLIPELGIDVPVEAVGLDGQGRMALPADPAIAAWYRFGSAPASVAGSTVIAAHVDSLVYDIGPFAKLAGAAAGTRIEVTTADGAVYAFALASTEVVPKESVDWSAVFARDGSPRLTLVTCGGEFDYDARRYLSNVVVTASPIT
ncbi:class F sortase [Agromyces sp. Marseille-P2726]|uniref:class F sortase n=1 Tax=Agromyces sp. Marseille-P2726 TaxID=2709132 RepID=UPI001570BAAC|nr:class F sortase [Agromyces sp. Marseille-P2726]